MRKCEKRQNLFNSGGINRGLERVTNLVHDNNVADIESNQ